MATSFRVNGFTFAVPWSRMAHGHQIRTSVLGAAMKLQAVVFVLLLLASSAAAQNPAQAPANQGTSTPSPDQAVITNQDVIGMLKAGLSPEIVAAKVKNSKCQCDTRPPAIEELRAAGAPGRVIFAMIASAALSFQKPGPLEVENAIALIPKDGGSSIWLLYTPKGNSIEVVPEEDLAQALASGYTLVQSPDLPQLLRIYVVQNGRYFQDLKALTSDYNQLVGKYNALLAAVQSARAARLAVPPPQTRPDNSDLLLNYLLFQSLMPKPTPPVPYQVIIPTPIPPVRLNNGINCTSSTYGNQTYTNCH